MSKSAFFGKATTSILAETHAVSAVENPSVQRSQLYPQAWPSSQLHGLTVRFPSSRKFLWDRTPVGRAEVVEAKTIVPALHVSSNFHRSLGPSASAVVQLSCPDGRRLQAKLHSSSVDVPGPGDSLVVPVVEGATSVAHRQPNYQELVAVVQESLDRRGATRLTTGLALSLTLQRSGQAASNGANGTGVHGDSSGGPATLIAALLTPEPPLKLTPLYGKRLCDVPLAQSLSRGQGSDTGIQTGYLTMDQSRSLLPLAADDNNVFSVPLVGVWVRGARGTDHPTVYGTALRFAYSSTLPDRATQPDGAFLLLLFTGDSPVPRCYEARFGDDVPSPAAPTGPLSGQDRWSNPQTSALGTQPSSIPSKSARGLHLLPYIVRAELAGQSSAPLEVKPVLDTQAAAAAGARLTLPSPPDAAPMGSYLTASQPNTPSAGGQQRQQQQQCLPEHGAVTGIAGTPGGPSGVYSRYDVYGMLQLRGSGSKLMTSPSKAMKILAQSGGGGLGTPASGPGGGGLMGLPGEHSTGGHADNSATSDLATGLCGQRDSPPVPRSVPVPTPFRPVNSQSEKLQAGATGSCGDFSGFMPPRDPRLQHRSLNAASQPPTLYTATAINRGAGTSDLWTTIHRSSGFCPQPVHAPPVAGSSGQVPDGAADSVAGVMSTPFAAAGPRSAAFSMTPAALRQTHQQSWEAGRLTPSAGFLRTCAMESSSSAADSMRPAGLVGAAPPTTADPGATAPATIAYLQPDSGSTQHTASAHGSEGPPQRDHALDPVDLPVGPNTGGVRWADPAGQPPAAGSAAVCTSGMGLTSGCGGRERSPAAASQSLDTWLRGVGASAAPGAVPQQHSTAHVVNGASGAPPWQLTQLRLPVTHAATAAASAAGQRVSTAGHGLEGLQQAEGMQQQSGSATSRHAWQALQGGGGRFMTSPYMAACTMAQGGRSDTSGPAMHVAGGGGGVTLLPGRMGAPGMGCSGTLSPEPPQPDHLVHQQGSTGARACNAPQESQDQRRQEDVRVQQQATGPPEPAGTQHDEGLPWDPVLLRQEVLSLRRQVSDLKEQLARVSAAQGAGGMATPAVCHTAAVTTANTLHPGATSGVPSGPVAAATEPGFSSQQALAWPHHQQQEHHAQQERHQQQQQQHSSEQHLSDQRSQHQLAEEREGSSGHITAYRASSDVPTTGPAAHQRHGMGEPAGHADTTERWVLEQQRQLREQQQQEPECQVRPGSAPAPSGSAHGLPPCGLPHQLYGTEESHACPVGGAPGTEAPSSANAVSTGTGASDPYAQRGHGAASEGPAEPQAAGAHYRGSTRSSGGALNSQQGDTYAGLVRGQSDRTSASAASDRCSVWSMASLQSSVLTCQSSHVGGASSVSAAQGSGYQLSSAATGASRHPHNTQPDMWSCRADPGDTRTGAQQGLGDNSTARGQAESAANASFGPLAHEDSGGIAAAVPLLTPSTTGHGAKYMRLSSSGSGWERKVRAGAGRGQRRMHHRSGVGSDSSDSESGLSRASDTDNNDASDQVPHAHSKPVLRTAPDGNPDADLPRRVAATASTLPGSSLPASGGLVRTKYIPIEDDSDSSDSESELLLMQKYGIRV